MTANMDSEEWPDNTFVSVDGIKVSAYHIDNGLWGARGNELMHRAIVVHETGHFFGK